MIVSFVGLVHGNANCAENVVKSSHRHLLVYAYLHWTIDCEIDGDPSCDFVMGSPNS